MPINITPSSTPITIKVCRAWRASGALNTGTPLAIASTPVMAAQPEEKAFNTNSRLKPSVARIASTAGAGGAPPCNNRKPPIRISSSIEKTKA